MPDEQCGDLQRVPLGTSAIMLYDLIPIPC